MNFFQLLLSINRTSLLRLNESQAVPPHQGLTLPGTINIYDMGWRLASRASHMPSDRQRQDKAEAMLTHSSQ
ncbi:hypothetical protein TNCV_2420331 [Trichonephila clavipes]|nr:hypothetical protein TNCV_2420331 [Trichonephila clavipes]